MVRASEGQTSNKQHQAPPRAGFFIEDSTSATLKLSSVAFSRQQLTAFLLL
ncbi:hypothetical protein SynROS8604_01694 [Synechococcus sp. ROS8604]|nr:hypothetical protein SynROS8604_01694 [Synechococcus sp. ROS8604]